MEILRRILFIGFIICPLFSFGQESFWKKYKTQSSFNTGNGLTQLPDSSYAITGASGGFDNASGQAFLMLVDSLGRHLWTKAYGGAGDDVGVRVFHKENEGFYIAGYSNSTDAGDFDFVLFKTDESGQLLWEKKYGTENWEILKDAVRLDDGGFILVGESVGPTTNGKDGYMIRVDSNGDEIWSQSLGTPLDDAFNGVALMPDNRFAVVGDYGNSSSTELEGTVIAFDIDGNQQWLTHINAEGKTSLNSVASAYDNLYIVGTLFGETEDSSYAWHTVVDLDGNYSLGNVSAFYQGESRNTALVVRDHWSVYVAWQSNSDDIDGFLLGNNAYLSKFTTDFVFNDLSEMFSAIGEHVINQVIISKDWGITFVGTASDAISNDHENDYNQLLGTVVMLGKLDKNDGVTYEPEDGIDMVSVLEEQINTIQIHPNPTKDNISFPEEVIHLEYQIADSRGQIVQKGKTEKTISIGTLKSGLYFIMIQDKDKVWTGKIIKE